jgi:hypothetical protein
VGNRLDHLREMQGVVAGIKKWARTGSRLP